jgi:Tfp pilus assembly protein PilF
VAYAQKGDKVGALQELKEAIQVNPTPEETQKIEALIARLR